MRTSRLLLIRHGERADLVPNHEWQQNRGPRPRDPPLTDHGRTQAVNAATSLSLQGVVCPAIYCSPLLRCLQTASEIALTLDAPIKIVVPLAKSCSYFRKCKARGLVPQYAGEEEARRILADISPQVRVLGYEIDDGSSCRETLDHLAIQALQEQPSVSTPVIVVVGHCDSQLEMARASGYKTKLRVPYCGIADFELLHQEDGTVSWKLVKKPEPVADSVEMRGEASVK